MDELITINLLIGDRTYRVKINPADEEQVRKTLKIINDKIIEFKTHFAGKDMQDYIAMVLLWFATQSNNQQQQNTEVELLSKITQSINLLEKEIDKHLND